MHYAIGFTEDVVILASVPQPQGEGEGEDGMPLEHMVSSAFSSKRFLSIRTDIVFDRRNPRPRLSRLCAATCRSVGTKGQVRHRICSLGIMLVGAGKLSA